MDSLHMSPLPFGSLLNVVAELLQTKHECFCETQQKQANNIPKLSDASGPSANGITQANSPVGAIQ